MCKLKNSVIKGIKLLLFSTVFAIFLNIGVFAATANTSDTVETVKKGEVIYSNNLKITLTSTDLKGLTGPITVTLNGAEWNNYSDTGDFGDNINYEKISDNELEISITVDKWMLMKECVISIPLKCIITKNADEIYAEIDYGIEDYDVEKVVIAEGDYSKASLNGSVTETSKDSEGKFNSLSIFIAGQDITRTINTISVTLEGASWILDEKTGKVSNDASANITYMSNTSTTIKIYTEVLPGMQTNGCTLTIPINCKIRKTGEIKAIVDFGYADIDISEVTFAYVSDGDLKLSSSSETNPVDQIGEAADVILTDSSTQNYSSDKEFTFTLEGVYRFYSLPDVAGTGKFEDKVKIKMSKTDVRKCIVYFTEDISSGTTGTITLKNIIIEKSSSSVPSSADIKMSYEAYGWKEYTDDVIIGKYVEGTKYNPPVRISVADPSTPAKSFSKLSDITFSDDYYDRSYAKGDKIVISFDNGFYWYTDGETPAVASDGKFANACEFQYNTENKNEAYIVFTKDINLMGKGTVTLKNAVIKRDVNSVFDILYVTAYVDSDKNTTNTVRAGKYSATLSGELETVEKTETDTAAVIESNTETEVVEIKFIIGQSAYYINNEEKTLTAPVYVKDGYTMLPVRVLANLVGIDNENISYSDGTAVFTISENSSLIISANTNNFILNGEIAPLSTSAEIKEGTMFLPMREIANALGIANDNISYDAETKTVTINTAV